MARSLTLVAVGDASSERAELLIAYTGNVDVDGLTPDAFVDNIQDIVVDHVPYSVHFVNTEPNDDYKSLRKMSYEKADCVVICYSINDRASFESVSKKWCIEIRRHVPEVPIILVATGIESRRRKDDGSVTEREGDDLKCLIGAAAFQECSVKRRAGIDDVFIGAINKCAVETDISSALKTKEMSGEQVCFDAIQMHPSTSKTPPLLPVADVLSDSDYEDFHWGNNQKYDEYEFFL